MISIKLAKFINNKQPLIIFSIILLIVTLFISHYSSLAIYLLLLFTILFISIIIPINNGGFILKLMVSFILVTCSIMIFGVFMWMIGIEGKAIFIYIFNYLLSVALIVIFNNKIKLNHTIHIQEIALLLFTVILFTITARPLLNGVQSVSTATNSGDISSHIELVSTVKNNKGYYYVVPELSRDNLTENLSGYPQGTHFLTWSLTEPLNQQFNKSNNGVKYISIILLFYTGLYYLLMIILGLIIFSILRIRTSFIKLLTYITFILFLLSYIFTEIMLPILALGFYTQINAMIYLTTLILIVYLHNYTKENRLLYLILAWLLVCGIAFSWLFILPIAYLIMLAFYYKYFTNIKLLLKPKIIITTIIFFAVSFVQIYIQLNYSIKSNLGINEDGFVNVIKYNTILPIYLLLLGVSLTIKTKSSKFAIVFSLVSTGMFAIILYIYQIISLGYLSYYFYKSLYVIIPSLLLAGSYLLLITVKNINIKNNLLSIVSITIMIFAISLPTFSNITDYTSAYNVYKRGPVDPSISRELANIISQNPSETANVIFIGSCDRIHDYISNRLLVSTTGNNNLQRQRILTLTNDKYEYVDKIEKYVANNKISNPIIVSSNQTLINELQNAQRLQGINIINIDNQNSTNLKYCPNKIL